jgi:hypothetical protein
MRINFYFLSHKRSSWERPWGCYVLKARWEECLPSILSDIVSIFESWGEERMEVMVGWLEPMRGDKQPRIGLKEWLHLLYHRTWIPKRARENEQSLSCII